MKLSQLEIDLYMNGVELLKCEYFAQQLDMQKITYATQKEI